MRIVFTGTHSTGKTTLVSLLARQWPRFIGNACTIQEVARSVLGRGLPLHYESTVETYLAITESHVAAERNNIDPCALIDRFLPDYAAYAVVHGNCPPDLLKIMEHCHYLLSAAYGYDCVFYLPIEFSVIDDGDRLTDAYYQRAVDQALRDILTSWNQPYSVLTGNIEDRLSQVLKVVRLSALNGI